MHLFLSRVADRGAYRLRPPIFGTMKTSAFSTNAQSRFASVVLDGVLGPDKDRLEDMDVSVNFPTRRKRPMIFPRPLGLNGSQV